MSIELSEALREAERWAKKSKSQYAGYALTYIYNIPTAIEDYGTKGLKAQLNYVLSNLMGWRGDIARKSKATMKECIHG